MKSNNKKILLNALLWLSSIVLFVIYYYYFISGKRIFCMDSEIWYGVFHYYTDSLWNGVLPTWNPYMHGGEPFFYNISILRLMDPVTMFAIVVGKIFNISIFKLYHFQYLLRVYVTALGVYFCCRYYTKDKFIAFTGFLAALLGHFSFFFLGMNGSLDAICWVPFIIYSLHIFIDKKSIFNFSVVVYFLGIYIGASNYHFAYGAFFLFIYFIFFLLFNWRHVTGGLGKFIISNIMPLILLSIIFIIFLTPLLALYIDKSAIIPVMRAAWNRWADFNAYLPLDTLWTELKGTYADVKQVLDGFFMGKYFPWLELFLAAVGIAFINNKFKKAIIIAITVTILVTIGPESIFHKLFYYAFFPLQLLRNFKNFISFFELGIIFLMVFGLSFLCNKAKELKKINFNALNTLVVILIIFEYYFVYYHTVHWDKFIYGLIGIAISLAIISKILSRNEFALSILFVVFIAAELWLPNRSMNTTFPFSQEYKFTFYGHVSDFPKPKERVFALPRTAYYLFDPPLAKENTAFDTLLKPKMPSEAIDTDYYNEWQSQGGFGAAMGPRCFFWLKDYFKVYSLGEYNLALFKALMGVQTQPFDFYEKVIMTDTLSFEDTIMELNKLSIHGNNSNSSLKNMYGLEYVADLYTENVNEQGQVIWEFPNGMPYKYYIIEIFPDNGSFYSLSELKFYAKEEPVQLGADRVSVSSVLDNHVAANLLDNKTETFWHINVSDRFKINFIIIDLTEYNGRAITKIVSSIRDSYPSQFWKRARLYGSNISTLNIQMLKREMSSTLFSKFFNQHALLENKKELSAEFQDLLVKLNPRSPDDLLKMINQTTNSQEDYKINLTHYSPNDVRLIINSSKKGIFVFRDAYDKYWRVKVDGVQQPLYKVNLMNKGVLLEKGTHSVHFYYQPTLFIFSFYAYVSLSFIFPVGLFIVKWKRRRFNNP